ncbi:MAG: CPBP family intramembrane glutamic endopeptidase [Candidatus Saccharimonadales bacterium]
MIYAVAIFLAAQVLASFIVAIYPYTRGWSSAHIESWLSSSTFAQFWYVLFAEALTFGGIFIFLRYRKSSLRAIGWRGLKLKDVAYALVGFGVYFVLYAGLLTVLAHLIPRLNINQHQDLGFSNTVGGIELVATFVSLVVLPPLVEETVFRGFLYSGLKNKLPVIWAAIITSLLFASAHLQFGNGKPLLWVAAVDTFTLSLVLCYLRDKTGGLWAGIGVHALKNGIAFVSLFLLHVR